LRHGIGRLRAEAGAIDPAAQADTLPMPLLRIEDGREGMLAAGVKIRDMEVLPHSQQVLGGPQWRRLARFKPTSGTESRHCVL
jgi:hypothetical protein